MLREEGSSLVHFERYSPSMEENTMEWLQECVLGLLMFLEVCEQRSEGRSRAGS